MSSAWKAALPLVLLLAAAPSVTTAPAMPTAAQIARWIEQLGDNDFATRQEASRLLWGAGRAAEEPLTRAARSDDLEVRRRANEVLEKFRWGLYPDTPRDLAALVARYQAGDADAKQAVVRELFDKGGAGCAVLSKILTAEPSDEVRKNLLLVVVQDAPRAFAALLENNEFSTLERFLDASLALPLNESAVQNYAAYWLLRGKLDDRFRQWEAKAAQEKDPAETYAVLTYLYRAKGDLAAARAAATKAGRQDLVEAVLVDQGDWAGLAKLADARDNPADFEALAYRLAYHRLAGDAAGVEKAVADLRGRVGPGAQDAVLWFCARALFLNDRPRDAFALLERYRGRSSTFDILTAQLKFREALALADGAKADDPAEQAAVEVLKGRALYLLGDRDKAREIFSRRGGEIAGGKEGKVYELLIKTEARLGLGELALEHAARLLAGPLGEGRHERLFGLLFPRHADRGQAWWQFLRERSPAEGPLATRRARLKQVRDLVEGRTSGKALEALAAEAARAARKQEPPAREEWLLAVADTCHAAGLDAAARDCLDQAAEAGTPAALLRLGDFLADTKAWAQAAARYGEAWQKERRNPLPLYLQGSALARGGDERQGTRLMELAHWVPLGEETVRERFAAELRKRGHDEAARRERRLLFALSKPMSFPAGEALREASLDALDHKEYLQAAADQDRALLRLLDADTEFVERSAYVGVPAYIHRLRALGLADAGRADDVRKEAAAALDLLPGNVELLVQLVPALDRLGRKKDADELFARELAVQQQQCADFPRSAWLHNNLAWSSACCRRHLDEGLEHARKAVALDPDSTGYRDTLAEVHFQRGERDRAIEEMKKCLAREGQKAYFQKQLKRFEAGDRAAELPGAGDD